MRRILGPALLVLLLFATSCGSDPTEVSSGDETAQPPDDQTDLEPESPGESTDGGTDEVERPAEPENPGAALDGQHEERAKFEAALATWSENGQAQYTFGYGLQCECWQGPWDIVVENGDMQSFMVDDGEPGEDPPYATVEAVFDEIRATIDEGRVPVKVRYDDLTGVPQEYVWNEPELPVDGGFVFVLEYFEPRDGGPDRTMARVELEEARARWSEAGLDDYDYTYEIGCFCVSSGPFEVEVERGEITSITGPPDEGLDDAFLAEVVVTVDELFATIDEAIDTAEAFTLRFDETLGYPTLFDVDYSSMIADDEATHILDIRPR